MISKNKIKFIQSLSRKKEREETGLFIAEGEKLILELLKANYHFDSIVTTKEELHFEHQLKSKVLFSSEDEMKKISLLKNPSPFLAIVKQPKKRDIPSPLPPDLILALDNLQDPGNMGTIIRLASWFGVSTIVCSEDCVDYYNPKVVQATMGALAHVGIFYTRLPEFLSLATAKNRTIYGTFPEGDNIYSSPLESNGIIVLGNEGKGISDKVKEQVTQKISIPSFKGGDVTVESLNVSIAAAIVCSEFRRRVY
jgi:TrmH family RNA methyltransferase